MLQIIEQKHPNGWSIIVLDSAGSVVINSGEFSNDLLVGYQTIKSATIKAALNKYASQLDKMLIIDYLDLLDKFDWDYYKDPSICENREIEYLSAIIEEIAKTSEQHSKLYTAYFNCMLNYSPKVYSNLQELLKTYGLSKREILK